MTLSDKDGGGAGAIARLLLRWYDDHARSLPWRIAPGSGESPDPYRVWLSEIMLQQTTVAAVAPYFAEFTRRWPTVADLAAAPDEDVLAAWAGLGYYARARNLIACAREVVAAGGVFPDTEEGLRALPGVGAYTAAAIAAIAFGRRAVVVDANVERVVSRLFAIRTPLPASKPEIRTATDAITPEDRAGDFAQAMMDLGARVCTVREPACLICPIANHCDAREQGIAAILPAKTPKKPRPERTGTAFWIERGEGDAREVLLVSRPAKGMLAGMRALPSDGWSARGDGDGVPPVNAHWQVLEASVTHGFTHFTLTMQLMAARHDGGDVPEGEWWPVARIGDAGLPTLFARAAAGALACWPDGDD
ncbi:A/G-specific adenine glycosylase [Croceicoccus mobilis]|nr:A/G-specific adenine glycosylase [Croceicoccus mobilis]